MILGFVINYNTLIWSKIYRQSPVDSFLIVLTFLIVLYRSNSSNSSNSTISRGWLSCSVSYDTVDHMYAEFYIVESRLQMIIQHDLRLFLQIQQSVFLYNFIHIISFLSFIIYKNSSPPSNLGHYTKYNIFCYYKLLIHSMIKPSFYVRFLFLLIQVSIARDYLDKQTRYTIKSSLGFLNYIPLNQEYLIQGERERKANNQNSIGSKTLN